MVHFARAFTLVELLVTIAVIGVLIGVLLPAVSRAGQAATGEACLVNSRSFGHAMTLYGSDYNFYFPRSSHSAGNQASPIAWLKCLEPYGVTAQARKCPDDPARDSRQSSYATNDHLEPLVPGIDYSPITGRPLPGGRSRALTRITDLPRPGATFYTCEPLGTGTIDHVHSIGWASASQVRAALAVGRHLNASNFAYADGRAAPVAWPWFRDNFGPTNNPFNPLVAR